MQSQRTIGTVLVALAAVLTITAAAQASPITSLFSTGVDASGSAQPNYAAELHYILVSAPAGAATGLRVATTANGFPIPPWIADSATSAWVGPNAAADLDGPTGNYSYRTTFDLTGFQASTASIAGAWSADNAGTDIVLNGSSTGNTAGGFGSFYNFAISTGFVAGVNTLDFIVYNEGGPTGLRVDLAGSATADSLAVPEPVSLALLGSGLFALGLFRRRSV